MILPRCIGFAELICQLVLSSVFRSRSKLAELVLYDRGQNLNF
jgi:hypothetical protein